MHFEIVEIGKQLLMTRGTLTTFSIANDVAKLIEALDCGRVDLVGIGFGGTVAIYLAIAEPRLVRALAVEMHENWIEAMQYLNMEPLAEQKKEALRRMGDAA